MAGNRIYYFSATGNSLQAARTIAAALDCTPEPMEPGMPLPEGLERIGIVFPVFYWGLPKRVIAFASAMDLTGNRNAYVFAAVTCGGLQGAALPQLNSLLKDKGCRLDYSAVVPMVGNYVIEYDIAANADDRIKKAQAKLEAAAQDIARKKKARVPAGIPGSGHINSKFLAKVEIMDNNFSVSGECISCGTCLRVCPVGNIRMEEGRPVFGHHCENCLACLHWCPEAAINYAGKTKSRRRYHHPAISVSDITYR